LLAVERGQNPKTQAGEGNHYRKHPELRSRGLIGAPVQSDGSVMGKRERRHVTDDK
jgi:hypothetical protein